MYEKVNPQHPDKVADRIAGAIVDLCYKKNDSPKAAVEVLLGHGRCFVIAETSEDIKTSEVEQIVERICGITSVEFICVPQDKHLAHNQREDVRCGDNGIFSGVPMTEEQKEMARVAQAIYKVCPYDGKYIIDGYKYIACQSNINEDARAITTAISAITNPLGDWTGGADVDAGATNRKLGSDMGDAVTGGGLHGKDLSKADVSVNIYLHLLAQQTGQKQTACCAIGDREICGKPYHEVVEIAKQYIDSLGGFEKFAEWGLIR